MSDVWTTIVQYALAPAGALSLVTGLAMTWIGARAKRDVAASSSAARIAEADARAMPSMLRRMEQQDQRIDGLGKRLDECEEKHQAALRRGEECDEKHGAVLARAEELSAHVAELQAQLDRQDADVTSRIELAAQRVVARVSMPLPPPPKRKDE